MKDNNLLMVFRIIKWVIKMLLGLTGILPFARCSSGYSEKNGRMTFYGKEIKDKNFIVLNGSFAKDSATAYYKEYAFSYADVASFTAVDEHYAKDKNKVYYCDEHRDGQNYYLTKHQTIKELKLAHPSTFTSLNFGYGKDSAHAYFEGNHFPVRQVASLTAIDNHFSKDNVQAYLNCQPIAGSQGKTFELLADHYARDNNHIYYFGYTGEAQHNICILPCDRQSFTILDYRYSKDTATIFFLGFMVKGADPSSFKILSSGYSTDKNGVYFESKKIAMVNAATFTIYEENERFGHDVVYATDNQTVFMNGARLPAANAASFKVLGENYGSDEQHVFYKSAIVRDADPASFNVYPHDIGNADAEDANRKFHEGKKLVHE